MPDAALDDDDLAAAELVLRLPDADGATASRARMATDPGFAARVDRWEARLAPLFAEITPVDPPAGLWSRLDAAMGDPATAAWRRRVRRWQWATGAASALAAGLAIMVALPAPPSPVVPPVAAPVPLLAVAQLSDDRGTPLLAVGIERRSGLVRVRLQDMPRQARVPELWIIPAGAAPRSLGLIAPDGSLDARIPDDLRGDAAGQATLAVSMEHADGAPHAAPAGPIVATGAVVTL